MFLACVVQCTTMKGSIDITAFGWLWPGISSHDHTRNTGLDLPDQKREREGEGKMFGRHFIWLKEDLEAVRENIADDGYCKIRGIRKVHRIITKPNKPNGVKVYSSSLLHMIITHNHLPFFEIFWNFVNSCPNFQIFFPFSTFLCPFSEKSQPLPFTF